MIFFIIYYYKSLIIIKSLQLLSYYLREKRIPSIELIFEVDKLSLLWYSHNLLLCHHILKIVYSLSCVTTYTNKILCNYIVTLLIY